MPIYKFQIGQTVFLTPKFILKFQEEPALIGQVRGLLDIFTWVASFEVFALRPTWASYS